jgi:hypothetical protein
MNEQQRYERARARVVELRGFYFHVFFYVVINAGLAVLNLVTSPSALWFPYVLLGWGIGLGAHALYVYVLSWRWGSDWEERKIREELDRQARS